MYSGCITDIAGVKAGHYTDKENMTGCTVIIIDGEGGVCGVDVRGSAPGTRETDLLRPTNAVQCATCHRPIRRQRVWTVGSRRRHALARRTRHGL